MGGKLGLGGYLTLGSECDRVVVSDVTVAMDGSTSEGSEWIEDEDNVSYPVYGYGNKRDEYLECVDTERLPVRYVASYSASVQGESVESVLEALRARVKSDLVIR